MKLAFMLFLTSITMIAGDVSGTWSGKWDVPAEAGEQPHYMVLTQTADSVTGTAGPHADQQFNIRNGKMADDQLSFEVALPDGTVMHFDFKMNGEAATGQALIEAGGRSMTVKLSVKRVKAS